MVVLSKLRQSAAYGDGCIHDEPDVVRVVGGGTAGDRDAGGGAQLAGCPGPNQSVPIGEGESASVRMIIRRHIIDRDGRKGGGHEDFKIAVVDRTGAFIQKNKGLGRIADIGGVDVVDKVGGLGAAPVPVHVIVHGNAADAHGARGVARISRALVD